MIFMNWIVRIIGVSVFLVLVVLFKAFLHKTIVTHKKNYVLPVYSNFKTENDEISNMLRDISDSGKCSYSTLKSLNSDSINMTFYFPCSWKEYDENKNLPTLIKQYATDISDTCSVGLSVDITTSRVNLTDDIIKQIRTKKVLMDLTKSSGDFVSFRSIEIGAILGDEVILKKISRNRESTIYSLQNHFYYNNRIITITYFVFSENQSHALTVFNRYIDSFRSLVKRTKISKLKS